MTNHLWQSTFFAAAAALLAFALRKNRAEVRYWLWFTASVKFLVPLSLLMMAGNQLRPIAPAVNAAPSAVVAMEQFTQPFSDTATVASPTNWTPWLLSLWSCGFLGILAIRIRDARRVREVLRASSPV